MMIAGLLIWGGSLWAVAQTRMTIAQLFERIEENSKSLRTSKSGVEAASIGIESAKSKKLPDLDASLSFSYIGNALMTDRDFSNAQGLKSPHFGNNFAFQAQQVVYAGGAINAGIRLAELGKQQNFVVLPLNLTEIETIPEDASGVILAGAKYDVSERELIILQAYWERKRSTLLVLLDPSGETPNLQRFLAANGVTPRPDRVLYAESTSAGPKKLFSVQTIFLPDSPISRPFTEAAASFSGQTQSLDLKADSADLRAQHINVTPLVDAADRFWGETRFEAELPTVDAQDTKPPLHLAASVERGAVSDERLRVDSARMVVVGNASMLDPATRLGVHQDFIAASLNWMLNRERLIGITPKRQRTFRIEITENHRRQIFWVTALLMPGAVLGFGFLVWNHRRA